MVHALVRVTSTGPATPLDVWNPPATVSRAFVLLRARARLVCRCEVALSARAPGGSAEEHPAHEHEDRQGGDQRPGEVPDEGGHLHVVILRHLLHQEVGGVADVRPQTPTRGSGADGREDLCRHPGDLVAELQGSPDSTKHQVGRGVVEPGAEGTGGREELHRCVHPKIRRQLCHHEEGRRHRHEDPQKQGTHDLERRPLEAVLRSSLLLGGEVRQCPEANEHRLTNGSVKHHDGHDHQ